MMFRQFQRHDVEKESVYWLLLRVRKK
uniref:Uncharacterized protein n=1 Tax=Rhizophora mucronata TaxID=61149 RepID=A0A2P2R328_RHIMU